MAKFNDKQLAVINSDPGFQYVAAGPGTGKTEALVGFALNRIHVQQIPANRILFLTFTNKIRNELR